MSQNWFLAPVNSHFPSINCMFNNSLDKMYECKGIINIEEWV